MAVQLYLVYHATGTVDPIFSSLELHPEIAGTYFSNTVGASGAVFGILVGFGMLFPNTELMFIFFPIPVKAKYFVSLYVIGELYLGIKMSNGDNVAHFAHLGGALFGYILIKIWNKNRTTLY
jgi:rhomboid-like protein